MQAARSKKMPGIAAIEFNRAQARAPSRKEARNAARQCSTQALDAEHGPLTVLRSRNKMGARKLWRTYVVCRVPPFSRELPEVQPGNSACGLPVKGCKSLLLRSPFQRSAKGVIFEGEICRVSAARHWPGVRMSLELDSAVGDRLRFGEFELAPVARALLHNVLHMSGFVPIRG
jgi:hypothetical protein